MVDGLLVLELDVLFALVELVLLVMGLVLEGVVLVLNVVGVGVALVDDTPLTTLKGFVNSVPTFPATAAVTSEGILKAMADCARTTSRRRVPRTRRLK